MITLQKITLLKKTKKPTNVKDSVHLFFFRRGWGRRREGKVTEPHCTAQAGLEFTILLSQSLKYWDDRCAALHLAYNTYFFFLFLWYWGV
jgi:hypothetical protein